LRIELFQEHRHHEHDLLEGCIGQAIAVASRTCKSLRVPIASHPTGVPEPPLGDTDARSSVPQVSLAPTSGHWIRNVLQWVVSFVGHGHDGLGLVFEFGEFEGRCGSCGEEACDEGGTDEQHARRYETADLEAVEERAACGVEE
jgi:hypothetical protein